MRVPRGRPPEQDEKFSWQTLLSLVLSDRELYVSVVIGIVILISEITVPEGWQMFFRSVALILLVLGLALSIRNKRRTAIFLQSEKHVPIVMAVDVPRRIALANLELAKHAISESTGFDEFSRIEDSFNVHYEDLLAHSSERLQPVLEDWADFLEESGEEISRFVQHVSGGHVFHVFIHGPSSLALGLGAVLGTRNRAIGYHYIDGKYTPVLDLSRDTRRIKTGRAAEPYKYFDVTYPEAFTDDTAVVLDMAAHNASGAVQNYLDGWDNKPALVKVCNTYEGNLSEIDWTPVVTELYSALSVLQRSPRVRRIHLFHSTPVPLALGVGMALGTFVPITVYNWEQTFGTYHPVLQLNQLEASF